MTTRDVLIHWLEFVNAGDAQGAAALYAPDAALLPTFSARALLTHDDRVKYFEMLAGRPQSSVTLHEGTVREFKLSDTAGTLSGLYAFRFELDGQLLTFEARFTYVIDTAQRAPILHHHSSQIPRGM